MPALSSGLCRSHDSRSRRRYAEENLSDELNQCFTGPDSHLDIRTALERVFKAYADNRISPRRAATFGYLAQLIIVAKNDAEKLSKRELHDLYNSWSACIRAAYFPKFPKRQTDAKSASPENSATAPSSNNPGKNPNNNRSN